MTPPPFFRPFGSVLCVLSLLAFAIVRPPTAWSTPSSAVNPSATVDAAPVIKPASVSAVVNLPFTFQVRATNSPTSYSTPSDLPAGLTLDSQTGIISGTPTLAGFYTVTIQAANATATTSADLQLAVYLKPVPTVNITVEQDATIVDGKVTAGSFLLTRTGGDLADAVKVGLAVGGGALGGVDYTALKTAANIKGNKGLKHLKVMPIDHGATDPGKKVVRVTLQPGFGYVLGDQTIAKLKVIVGE